ncbi:hypothetical protein PF003_g11896 [Phytophthora fragariae]|nr:hypothetical protein PF003_g11896 [Phytophthora fragariae]
MQITASGCLLTELQSAAAQRRVSAQSIDEHCRCSLLSVSQRVVVSARFHVAVTAAATSTIAAAAIARQAWGCPVRPPPPSLPLPSRDKRGDAP